MLSLEKWIKDNLGEHAQRDKGRFSDFANDTSSANWGCDRPIINGFQIAWITLSPQHKGDIQSIFYDYIEV